MGNSRQPDWDGVSIISATAFWPLLTFAASVQLAAMAVGVYSPDSLQSLRFAIARLLVAISLGVIFMAIMAFALPGMTLWRSNSLYAMGLAFVYLATGRAVLGSLDRRHRL